MGKVQGRIALGVADVGIGSVLEEQHERFLAEEVESPHVPLVGIGTQVQSLAQAHGRGVGLEQPMQHWV